MIVATDRFGNSAVYDPFVVDLGFGVHFRVGASRLANASTTSARVNLSTAPSSVTNNLDNSYRVVFTLTARLEQNPRPALCGAHS